MRKIILSLLIGCFSISLFAQQNEIKNVILMIPDGTSESVLSLSRWYKGYLSGNRNEKLALDPYLCGVVKTFSSNAPIGDSAPTTSCYMTGQPSLAGWISTYPAKTNQDLVPLDAARTYQPLATVFEAAKILKRKSVGLIATSYIVDATPADCMAHCYNRHKNAILTKQFVFNDVDVALGGGNKDAKKWAGQLQSNGVTVVFDDADALRETDAEKLWALFDENSMPYHLDCDSVQFPTLAEMTEIAIRSLSKNPEGFVLMVEGSKVDWAAHNNDAKAMVDEFLEFDKAVKVALDFAKKDGNTVVVMLPDHGNSGLSIGSANTHKSYKNVSLDTIMKPLVDYTISAEKFGDWLASCDNAEIKPLFKKLCSFDLSENDCQRIVDAKEKAGENSHSKTAYTLSKIVTDILYKNSCFGFTTYGHTGEDVFLAVYHPFGDIPVGLNTNVDVYHYLCRQLGVEGQMETLTDDIYAKHQEVFAGYELKIEKLNDDPKDENYRLIVKGKKQKIEIESFTNYFLLNGKKIDLGSVVIYVDKNETFYLPKKIKDYLE